MKVGKDALALSLYVVDAHDTGELRYQLERAGHLDDATVYAPFGAYNLLTVAYGQALSASDTRDVEGVASSVERIEGVAIEDWPGRSAADGEPRYLLVSLLKLSERLLLVDSYDLLDVVGRWIGHVAAQSPGVRAEAWLGTGWEDIVLLLRGDHFGDMDQLRHDVRQVTLGDLERFTGGPLVVPEGKGTVAGEPVLDFTLSIFALDHRAWDEVEGRIAAHVAERPPVEAEAWTAEIDRLRALAVAVAPVALLEPTGDSQPAALPATADPVVASCAAVTRPTTEAAVGKVAEHVFFQMCPTCGALPVNNRCPKCQALGARFPCTNCGHELQPHPSRIATFPGRVDLFLWRPVHALPLRTYLDRLIVLEVALNGYQSPGRPEKAPFRQCANLGVRSIQSTLVRELGLDSPAAPNERDRGAALALRALSLSSPGRTAASPPSEVPALPSLGEILGDGTHELLPPGVRDGVVHLFHQFDRALVDPAVGAAVLDLYPALRVLHELLRTLQVPASDGSPRPEWVPPPPWTGGDGLPWRLANDQLAPRLASILAVLDLALRQRLRHRANFTGNVEQGVGSGYGAIKLALGVTALYGMVSERTLCAPGALRPPGICLFDLGAREVEVIPWFVGVVRLSPSACGQPERLLELLHELGHPALQHASQRAMRREVRRRLRALPDAYFRGPGRQNVLAGLGAPLDPHRLLGRPYRQDERVYEEIYCDCMMLTQLGLLDAHHLAWILGSTARRNRASTPEERRELRRRFLAVSLLFGFPRADLRQGGRGPANRGGHHPFVGLDAQSPLVFRDRVHAQLVRPTLERLGVPQDPAEAATAELEEIGRMLGLYGGPARAVLAEGHEGDAFRGEIEDDLYFLRRFNVVIDTTLLRQAAIGGEDMVEASAASSPPRGRRASSAEPPPREGQGPMEDPGEAPTVGEIPNLHWDRAHLQGSPPVARLHVPAAPDAVLAALRELVSFLQRHASAPRMLEGERRARVKEDQATLRDRQEDTEAWREASRRAQQRRNADRWAYLDADLQTELFQRRTSLQLALWHAAIGYREEILRLALVTEGAGAPWQQYPLSLDLRRP